MPPLLDDQIARWIRIGLGLFGPYVTESELMAAALAASGIVADPESFRDALARCGYEPEDGLASRCI